MTRHVDRLRDYVFARGNETIVWIFGAVSFVVLSVVFFPLDLLDWDDWQRQAGSWSAATTLISAAIWIGGSLYLAFNSFHLRTVTLDNIHKRIRLEHRFFVPIYRKDFDYRDFEFIDLRRVDKWFGSWDRVRLIAPGQDGPLVGYRLYLTGKTDLLLATLGSQQEASRVHEEIVDYTRFQTSQGPAAAPSDAAFEVDAEPIVRGRDYAGGAGDDVPLPWLLTPARFVVTGLKWIAILFLVGAAGWLGEAAYFVAKGVEFVEGTVSDVEVRSEIREGAEDSHGEDTTYTVMFNRPTVRYKTIRGAIRIHQADFWSESEFVRGEKITVLYPPDDPSQARILVFDEFFSGPLGLAAAGLVFLFFSWMSRLIVKHTTRRLSRQLARR